MSSRQGLNLLLLALLLLVIGVALVLCDSTHDGSTLDEDATTPKTIGDPPADSTDSKQLNDSSTEASIVEPTTQQAPTTMPKQTNPCDEDNYCLNGGTCVVSETGQKLCICPEGYYGSRCQLKDICKTVIVDGLKGDQICEKIQRPCFKNDKFFRCSCLDDEYFIFKTHNQPGVDARTETAYPSQQAIFQYENEENEPTSSSSKSAPYLAECRKIDKCLGVRCRQKSEICLAGECVCNQNAGYSKDPTDGLCKLLNPCLMPTADGQPICGQAQCVATYDNNLFKCICPVGYRTLKRDASKSSTRCVLSTSFICNVPLLNKCQHICQIDQITNSYKCSCLPGYKQGTQPGIDDHMCFFDDNPSGLNMDEYRDEGQGAYSPRKSGSEQQEFDFKPYIIPRQPSSMEEQDYDPTGRVKTSIHEPASPSDGTFVYDPMTPVPSLQEEDEKEDTAKTTSSSSLNDKLNKAKSPAITYIKREIRSVPSPSASPGSTANKRHSDPGLSYEQQSSSYMNKLSPQQRCNMYCEDNKICVLENGSTDSYRCVCDRQGYISIGDRCLDWCSAAEFSYRVQFWLENTCYSGVCKASGNRPTKITLSPMASELETLEVESSWRPSFECDCTHSPLLLQDPKTKLCKLDFQAILNPCLPGNEGYVDCVENKNAYCSVLHKSPWAFFWSLRKERPTKVSEGSLSGKQVQDQADIASGKTSGGANKTKKPREKLYTCVCSPDKKFLVDKPRNKARCVNECDLLNTECGRFNRMCRSATMAPDDFGRHPLVRMDTESQRMNIRRTGCECLPGFNVGPSESVDFTLDDNMNGNSEISPSTNRVHGDYPYDLDGYTLPVNIIDVQNDETEHLRAKYMNINSRCLLDYDVIEFHASFKAPADFDPSWIPIRNAESISQSTAFNMMKGRLQSRPKVQSRGGRTTSLPAATEQQSSDNTDEVGKYQPASSTSATTKAPKMNACQGLPGCILEPPDYMHLDMAELHKSVVLVSECDDSMALLSLEAYQECTKYRYWLVQKLRENFVDWRRVINTYLYQTFDLMEGNIRVRVNTCEASIRAVSPGESSRPINRTSGSRHNWLYVTEYRPGGSKRTATGDGSDLRSIGSQLLDPTDQQALIDADIHCELTLHSASDRSSSIYSRKVFLERQLPKFIFMKPKQQFGDDYYLMAPNMLIRRESFNQLAEHRKLFDPCHSRYEYCDKQTKCEMVDAVNFTCTCDFGYTPIGSRDIYHADSRKEVCEDINECLFDVCKELENVSTCINEIGDYRCQCNRHYTGDNKRYCTHVCNTIPCKHGKCRLVDDHHAFCECDDGYKEADCSVQDPNVALRKANMIICGSIFTSVLLLAVTFAISLNSQLKKTKKKLKRLEAATEAAQMFEFTPQQTPFRTRMSKVSACS